jgi:hypothetical protein
MGEDSGVSVTKSLVTWVVIMATATAAFVLAISLYKNPFVVQITSAFGYTAWVFFLIFCDSRAWRGYSLRKKEVRQELPRLLSMHAAFLALLLLIETTALLARSSSPSNLRTEFGSKHDTLAYVLIFTGVGIGTTQALIARRILSRVVGSA